MTALNEVLNSLGLSAIYWIDDENASNADLGVEQLLEIIIENVRNGHSEMLGKFIAKVPEGWKKDLVALKKAISEDEKKPETERTDRTEVLRNTLIKLADDDSEDGVTILRNMVDSLDGSLTQQQKELLISVFQPLAAQIGYEWKPMSFTEWQQQEANILGAHTADHPALIMLDRQNTREQAPITGETILKNVCAHPDSRSAFRFLVVTNTCTTEDEFEHALRLSKELEHSGGIQSPLFLMAKNRIARTPLDQPDKLSSQFAELLSRLHLSALNQELTSLAGKAIEEATASAFGRLLKMSMHEFLYAVTQSSQYEGVSELDTLLRLIEIEQRDALMQMVTTSAPLRKALEAIRNVRVEIREKELSKSPDLKALRNREIYWPPEAVNRLHEPVAPGDIFSIHNGEALEYYMLIGNDCDLMLRQDGERNTITGVLAKFEENDDGGGLLYQLECPLPESPNIKFLRMTKFKAISIDVLDLCWTNADGKCIWSNKRNYDSLHLLMSQKARLAILKEIYADRSKVNRLIASSPFSWLHTRFSSTRAVNFEIRRVSRMSSVYARGVLTKFSTILARPSYDHDFANIRKG